MSKIYFLIGDMAEGTLSHYYEKLQLQKDGYDTMWEKIEKIRKLGRSHYYYDFIQDKKLENIVQTLNTVPKNIYRREYIRAFVNAALENVNTKECDGLFDKATVEGRININQFLLPCKFLVEQKIDWDDIYNFTVKFDVQYGLKNVILSIKIAGQLD